jgi:hypothetical protein
MFPMTRRYFMRIPIFLVSLLNASLAQAQNLVPNPSFEEYTDCPPSFGWWSDVVDWTSPYTASADYFNACAGGILCSVPFNNLGYQYPADGDAYMGICTYDGVPGGGNYREIIATELIEPLQPGIPVYLSFKTSPGGHGTATYTSATWTCKGVGMKFFVELPTDWQSYLYPNSAALYLDQVLNDTANWTSVSGVYVPDSAYRYVALTNFFSDSLSEGQLVDSTYGTYPYAYSFLDQICVSYDPNYCSDWNGLSTSSIDPFALWPNPFEESIELDGAHQDLSVQLFNVLGNKVWQGSWPSGQDRLVIHGGGLAQGPYLLRASNTIGASRSYTVTHVSP